MVILTASPREPKKHLYELSDPTQYDVCIYGPK